MNSADAIERLQAENAEVRRDMAARRERSDAGEDPVMWQAPEREPVVHCVHAPPPAAPAPEPGFSPEQVEAIGGALAGLRQQMRVEFAAEIGKVRSDHAGELTSLREELDRARLELATAQRARVTPPGRANSARHASH